MTSSLEKPINQKKNGIRLISEGEDSSDEDMSLSIEEIVKGAQKISSYSLQKYLGKLTHSLAKDTQTQFILANLDFSSCSIGCLDAPLALQSIILYRCSSIVSWMR
jgi:hypothetical protein